VEGLKNTRRPEENRLVDMSLVQIVLPIVFHRPLCNDFAATNNEHRRRIEIVDKRESVSATI